MKNKKGITLIEIIVSIVLISIVLVFLFSMLVTVNDINEESEVNTTYLINKALLIKTIEEDLINVKKLSESSESCDLSSDITSYALVDAAHFNICKKIKINDSDDYALLAIYYYNADPIKDYVITYKHGSTIVTRELPNFGTNNETVEIKFDTPKLVGTDTFYKIEIPIIGPDGKDYSIMIPYKTP